MENTQNKRPFLKVADVSKSFGEVRVLDGLNLELAGGEILGVIGPSGGGKTTLLRCLDLLEPFDAGTIEYATLDAKALPNGRISKGSGEDGGEATTVALRQQIGFVFQTFNLWGDRTVLQNLTLAPCVVKRTDRAEAEAIAERLLAKFGLSEKRENRIWQLSGGQRQRVAIIRALMMEPQILLCDEVTSALDPVLAYDVLQMIKALSEEGLTMIVVTHHVDFAATLCDRIAYLNDGAIQQIDTPERIIKSPRNEEIANFLNILRVAG